MSTPSYKKALAAPTAKGGRGWKYADADSMQAAMAQALGLQFCLNPQSIYDWATRHGVSLRAERNRLMKADVLLVAVLNNWSIERAEQELKG